MKEQGKIIRTGAGICGGKGMLIVQKYGGTSLQDGECVLRAARRLTEAHRRGDEVVAVDPDPIRAELVKGRIVVAAGFQGVDETGRITTLGRGGSDTTAVALAAALGADKCQIFTDVDGIYDRDPRRFADATRFDRIGYGEMLRLIASGAQVLHDRSVEMARDARLPLEVLSSFRPGPGTIVGPME